MQPVTAIRRPYGSAINLQESLPRFEEEDAMLDVKTFDRAAYAAKMRANGWWGDRTTDSLLMEAVAQHPDKDAIVAYRADRRDQPPRRFTFSEFGDSVARAAGALHALGVGAGCIVAVQVLNWWEFC